MHSLNQSFYGFKPARLALNSVFKGRHVMCRSKVTLLLVRVSHIEIRLVLSKPLLERGCCVESWFCARSVHFGKAADTLGRGIVGN